VKALSLSSHTEKKQDEKGVSLQRTKKKKEYKGIFCTIVEQQCRYRRG
jgi:hypothetical protein